MQLAMIIIWIINCLWLLKFPFFPFQGLKKMPIFELKLWANGKKQGLILRWKKVQTVLNTQKKKILTFQ